MGKAKQKTTNTDPLHARAVPLDEQIAPPETLKASRQKKRKRDDCEEESQIVTQKDMNKFLKLARQQIDDEDSVETPKPTNPVASKAKVVDDDDEDDEMESKSDVEDDDYVDEEELMDDKTKQELETFSSNLVDLPDDYLGPMFVKTSNDNASDFGINIEPLDEKIVSIFRRVAVLMKRHTHGSVPKPLKMVPRHRRWEEIIELTNPDEWSSAAVSAATKIFISNLDVNDASKFVNRVLLPRVRDDMKQYQKMNPHLYEALHRCMFKDYCFVKGFLLPLCKEGDCSINEAAKIASVLRCAMKVEVVGLAIMEICTMPFNPANCTFLTVLIQKKCALPLVVINELVLYFFKCHGKKEVMPERWHICLKSFTEIYKNNFSVEQRDALLDLLKKQNFPKHTKDIRRELNSVAEDDVEMSGENES